MIDKIWQQTLIQVKKGLKVFPYLEDELLSLVTNLKTPEYVLKDIFSYRRDYYIIYGTIIEEILEHPNTSLSILQEFINKDRGQVEFFLENITKRADLPISLWQKLLDLKHNKILNYPIVIPSFCEHNPDKLSLILKDYSEASSDLVRLIALLHLPFEPNKLERLINSMHWIYRYGVSQNINVTLSQLEKLTKDSNKVVRAAAKAQLETKP